MTTTAGAFGSLQTFKTLVLAQVSTFEVVRENINECTRVLLLHVRPTASDAQKKWAAEDEQ